VSDHGPLDGIRVLDLTSVVMGPMATQILGDLGADVISIESARGDTNRYMGAGPVPHLSDVALNLLRNKRNVALDLKHPDGRAAFLRIAATSDVVVTNLRPGPLGRLGLNYEAVRTVRPDIVFCRAQGFPTASDRADDPAYDDIIQAAAGVADVVARSGAEPALAPTLLGDKVSGLTLLYAILAALVHRERTGEGQLVEVAMVDALSSFMLVEHSAGSTTTTTKHPSKGYQRILTTARGPKQTTDGWIVIFPYLQSHWDDLLVEGGRAELAGDARLTHSARGTDPTFGYEILGEILATRSSATWLAFCREHGIPATAVATLDTLVSELPIDHHPLAGSFRAVPSPVHFARTPTSRRRPAPLIGENNREILSEVGYSVDELDEMERAGVFRT
jgi:crotonobetainyl-CoA:carnitine CoA-transferase CaiB-like acyl-CoA transferase